jgi:hypothetical protein
MGPKAIVGTAVKKRITSVPFSNQTPFVQLCQQLYCNRSSGGNLDIILAKELCYLSREFKAKESKSGTLIFIFGLWSVICFYINAVISYQ